MKRRYLFLDYIGGRGPKEVRGVQVITPGKPLKKDSAYDRRKKRHPFRRRAGIEP